MDAKAGHGHRASQCAVVVGTAIVVGLAGCGGEGGADNENSTAQPPAKSTASRAVFPTSETPAPVEPGTYQMPNDAWSVTDYSVTIPEGWTVTHGHIFSYRMDHPGEFGLYGVVVDEIFADACHGEEDPMKVGPGTDALVAALQGQPGPKASAPV